MISGFNKNNSRNIKRLRWFHFTNCKGTFWYKSLCLKAFLSPNMLYEAITILSTSSINTKSMSISHTTRKNKNKETSQYLVMQVDKDQSQSNGGECPEQPHQTVYDVGEGCAIGGCKRNE